MAMYFGADSKSGIAIVTDEQKKSYPARLQYLKDLDPKGYCDSGSIGLFHVLLAFHESKKWVTFNTALVEVERLYADRLMIAAIEKMVKFFCKV